MRVADHIIDILASCKMDGNALVIEGTLDRPEYVAVNKVLEAAGGKWNRKTKAHLFKGDAADVIEQIIQTGEVTDAKKEFQAFFTPDALAIEIVANYANMISGDPDGDPRLWPAYLEPSAGEGAFIKAVQRLRAHVNIFAYEIQEDLAKKVSQLLYPQGACSRKDFLTVKPVAEFDRVIMNPPFTRQQDIDHVLHALKFLKPGGRLVAIMSASVLFRTNRKTADFRNEIKDWGGKIEALPEGSFKESGTNVNTCVVVVERP